VRFKFLRSNGLSATRDPLQHTLTRSYQQRSMISKRFIHGQPQARKSCTAAEASDSIKALLSRIHTISHTDVVSLGKAIEALNEIDSLENTQDRRTIGKPPVASTPVTTAIAAAAMEEDQQGPDNKTNESKKKDKKKDKEETPKSSKKDNASGKKRTKPSPEKDDYNDDDEKRDKKKKKKT